MNNKGRQYKRIQARTSQYNILFNIFRSDLIEVCMQITSSH